MYEDIARISTNVHNMLDLKKSLFRWVYLLLKGINTP